MKNKTIILFALLLLSAVIPMSAAKNFSGSWKIFSAFDNVTSIADTPDKVYYVSSGQLYSYDKKNDETRNYSGSMLLSSPMISMIKYDSDTGKLVVVYTDANIDIIDNDGRVQNMPDIKDAQLSVVPEVNDVVIDGKKLYAATNFGCVVFDLGKYEVITAGEFGKAMFGCTIWGDYLLLADGDGNNYYVGKDEKLTSFNKLNFAFGYAYPTYMPISDTLLLMKEASNNVNIFRKDADKVPEIANMSEVFVKKYEVVFDVIATKDGGVVCYTPDELLIISKDGNIQTKSIAGTPLQAKRYSGKLETKHLSMLNGLGEVWNGSSEGVASYDLSNNGTVDVLMSPSKPSNSLTFSNIGRLYTSPSGKVYASNWGNAQIRTPFLNQGDNLFNINVIEDDDIRDVTPLEFTVENKNNPSFKVAPYGFRSGADFREDPNDPDAYYIGSNWDGVYHIKDRKQIHKYYGANCSMEPILNGYCVRAYGLDIDKAGNLWVSNYVFEGDYILHFLPADKRLKGETTKADWQALNPCKKETNSFEAQILACIKSNCVIYRDSYYQGDLHFVKTQGTVSTADDVVYTVNDFIDQDGKKISYNYLYFMVEDKLGHVWVGTDNGLFEITNPDDINSATVRVNHLKVPRKDGSNFADYLLDGEIIYWIAVDPANRKWVATANSGAYLVSANGDEIIKHFDTTNSPLQSNLVTAITCGNDNSVYLATQYGLVEYKSDASEPKDDYSEVYAYPNPVRPEYTGWITVTGLMDNSLVKIADAAGHVFFQGMSEGGMITWDGCDRSGNRVKTGVYYVFASSGQSGEASKGAVTKILVVN